MNAPLPAVGAQKHAPLSLGLFVGLLAGLMALNALATDIMLPAFPQIASSLGVASVTDVQAVITAYMMGFAFSQLFMGFVSDRYGRRPVLIGGLVVYTIASVFTAIAGDFSHLLAARFVQGLGSGAPRVIATASVRDCYDGRKMARVMSLTMTIFMAAPVLAPAIGQGILLGSSWRWVMGFIAIYGIIVLAVCWRIFPETLAVEDRRTISFKAIIAALKSVLGSRQTVGYTLAAGTFFGALFGFIGQAQQVMVDVYGLGVWFPLAFAVMALALSASSFINSTLVERFGMRVLSHFAVVVYCITTSIMYMLAIGDMLGFWPFAVIHSVNMLLVGLIFSNFNALAMEPQGRIAGVASSFIGAVTVGLGAGLGFLIGRQFDGTVAPLASGFVLSGIGTLLLILYTEKGRLFRPGVRPKT
jgi:DHA1 family bicyclomycin/chloramphenicol resistance-like MFS transporter